MAKNTSQSVVEILLDENSGLLSKAPLPNVEQRTSWFVAFFVLLVCLALGLSFVFFTSDSIERIERPSHVSSTHWSAPWLL